MMELFKSLTNSEIASLFWVWVFLMFIMAKSDISKSLYQVLLFTVRVKWLLLLAMIFMSLNMVMVNLFFWEYGMLKEIMVWCFVVPLQLLFNANKMKEDVNYFKTIMKNTMKLTVMLMFMINLYTFSIMCEMLLLSFILVFTVLSASWVIKEESKQVKNVSDYILALMWLIFLFHAINGFIQEPDKLLAIKNMYTFFTPVMLTMLYLPFIYLFALVMGYEDLMMSMKVFPNEKFSKIKMFSHIFKLCKFNLYSLSSFHQFYMISKTWGTEEYFLSVMDDFKKTL